MMAAKVHIVSMGPEDNYPIKTLTAPRAPRKQQHRKRRVTEDEEDDLRLVRTTCTWDMDVESTDAIMRDMGVAVLMDDDTPTENIIKPTPKAYTQDIMVPPQAPRHGISGFNLQSVTPAPLTYIEPQGTIIHNSFLHKRSKTDAAGTGYDNWEKLSDEIILTIFKWLPKSVLSRCARVCKRWYRLAFDEMLWRRLDLANKTLKEGVLGRVIDRGVAVLRLAKTEVRTPLYKDLNNSSLNSSFNSSAGSNPPPRLSRLQFLDLSMATISTEGLEELLSMCHYLRKLSLENCPINDQICRYIGQNYHLEVLNLCMCQGITENGLVPLCNKLQRLDSLNLAWTGMERGALLYLVMSLPPSVTKLNLSGCRDNLLDEDVQELCQQCPGLKELDLSDSTALTSSSVEYIASLLGGLEYIALSRCYHVAPSSFLLLSNILTLLALDVFGMLRETAVQQLRESLPNIEINKFPFSSIARPTTGIRRTSIWGLRVRDSVI